MKILGIETSCDETAISIVEAEGVLENLDFKILGSAINSQVKLHAEYGGVVPNLAKREHLKNLPLVLRQAFKEANFSLDTDYPKIDTIAVTVGPGLEPALWTGIAFAEELGKKWNIPVIGTNHMEGHITSVLFKADENLKSEILNPKIKFPAIALLISGGHTELVFMKSWAEKEKIGETLDDAVGEAFDKVARMLGLPYPGGPEISRLAEEARIQNLESKIKFPRPMIHSKDFNFSFSGLKTAVLYYLRSLTSPPSPLPLSRGGGGERTQFSPGGEVITPEIKLTVAREFEDSVIEVLLSKTKRAINEYLPKTLIIGGGVIANKALRENFLKLKENYPEMEVLIPEKSLTSDNATMIAAAGYIEYLRGDSKRKLKADGNLNIS